MANILGDLMVPNGTYQKDGEEKTSWLKIGVLLEVEKGGRTSMRGKIDCMPAHVPEGGLWFQVFAPRDFKRSTPAAQKPEDGMDDVPF